MIPGNSCKFGSPFEETIGLCAETTLSFDICFCCFKALRRGFLGEGGAS